ncbi:MAG TPA: lipoyl synthase [Desulfobacteraceae bacterium]|nr:lipoyl synthase [Desulfobacteraceae bacterium]
MNSKPGTRSKKPEWLRKRLPSGPQYEKIRRLLARSGLHTVCQEARCPNMFECFQSGTATFLILGDRCTRDCRFCAVAHGRPDPPDAAEPVRVAEAAATLGLEYVVVTSVTRDDLADGGASAFKDTIYALREQIQQVYVEVLIPDFRGSTDALEEVLLAEPNVLNHNIETVPRLYPSVRPAALYKRSLEVLSTARDRAPGLPVKSGMMLGLGESEKELEETFYDLAAAGCSLLTLGQYLQPTPHHAPVARFIPPEEFQFWKERAIEIGFKGVASGPFVRSSYHVREMYEKSLL